MADERLVAEQQLAQRAAAEGFQVQPTALQCAAAGHAAGEHPGLAMAAQVHLAHPAFAALGQVKGQAFVVAQALPAFAKGCHGKVIGG
ncbi:hypothetical protein D3C76_1440860 [compost metagenome]